MTTAKRSFSAIGSMLFVALAVLGCRDGTNPVTAGAKALSVEDPGMTQVVFSQEVCAPITETLIITENTKLGCDVVCTNAAGPCVQFGRDNITFSLAGYTMTGPAAAPNNCAPTSSGPAWDGISTNGFDRVKIRGPGMVQRFRRHGIFMPATDNGIVDHVTVHYNCYSGIFLNGSNENFVNENVSVRNSSASGPAPCGGNCLINSNSNRIRRNHFYGNGSLAPAATQPPTTPFAGLPNDFGVGLVGTSSDNIVEENSIGGNVNGILIFPLTVRNVIRHNVIAGNPPVQVEVSGGAGVGFDIRDASAPGANTFQDNHCITYLGASFESGNNASPNTRTSALPCPNFPRARGHN